MEKNDPIKLLAIDDTPDNLIALSAVVRDALPGTIVLKAENGLTGIELAVAEDPDVILLDIVMPGMDGFETCRRLKLNEKIRDVPVVFLTALKTDSNSRVKALEVGGEGFLAKPLEPNELIAQIQAMTKVKAANRSRITEKARLEILVTERTIALQQNKDLLHSSIEALTHRFAIINAETYDIEMANSAFGGDAVIGKKCYTVLHDVETPCPEDRCCPVLEVKKTGKPCTVECTRPDPQGNTQYLEIAAYPQFDENGKVARVIECIYDITERKQAEIKLRDSERKIKTWIENSPVCTKIVDLNFNLQFMSHAGIQDLKVDNINDYYGKPYPFDFYPESSKAGMTASLKKAKETRSIVTQEASVNNLFGETLWYHSTIVPVLDDQGTLAYLLVVSLETTARKKAEAQLVENAETHHKMITNIGDVIVVIDKNGINRYKSPSIEKWFGWKPADVVGHDCLENIHPDDRDRGRRFMDALALKPNASKTIQLRYLCKNGLYKWIELTMVNLLHDTSINGFLGNYRDITERKQAETYLEMGREIGQILNEPDDTKKSIERVITQLKLRTEVDAVGIRLQSGVDFPYLAQEGFSAEFLMTENSLVAFDKKGCLMRDSKDAVCLECTCGLVLSGKTDPSLPIFTPGGSFWTNNAFPLLQLPRNQDPRLNPRNLCIHFDYASIALIPIRTSDRIVGLIQLNDKRKGRFTLETIEILENIASYIGSSLLRKQTEEALKAAKEQAEAANVAKTQFIAKMSHELRTPMNGVLGFADLLQYTALDLTQKEYVKSIIESGSGLLFVIQEILDFSKVEAGKVELEIIETDLYSLIRETGKMIKCLADKKELAFRINIDRTIPRTVMVDPMRLRQILLNLLSNALKYTPQGEILLQAKLAMKTDDFEHITFSIIDTGVGISEESRKNLFKAFSQGDNSNTRLYGGTGLGLVISDRLAQLMGGKIEFVSTPGKGSEFFFTIETRFVDEEAIAARVKESTMTPAIELRKMCRILIAEDDKTNMQVACGMIQRLIPTAEIIQAENGKIALTKIVQTKPDIVFMDIQMPEMDGNAATLCLREYEKREKCQRTTVIGLTAHAFQSEKETSLASGMDDYLLKPINSKLIKDALTKHLKLVM